MDQYVHSWVENYIYLCTCLIAHFAIKFWSWKSEELAQTQPRKSCKHIPLANIKELLNILLTFSETLFQVWLEACHSTLRRKLFNFSNVSRFLTRLKYLYKTFLNFLWFYQRNLQRCFALINAIHFPLIGKATNLHTCLISIVPSFLIYHLNFYLVLYHEVQ